MLFNIELNTFVFSVCLFLLYAETHYAFKFFPSRLKKKEPEVIADVPHRLEPGFLLPVLILIKDADKFPIHLNQVKIQLINSVTTQSLIVHDFKGSLINEKFWWEILEVTLPSEINGNILIDVELTFNIKGRTLVYHNDNYRISSHRPFKVHVAQEALPCLPNWHFGDLHYHSSYSSDQVEFGAPFLPTIRIAKSLGLKFAAITDHSYDLDDMAEDFLENDPKLGKWQSLWQEADGIEQEVDDFVIIPGEEVSVGNAKNRNVHLLVLNDREFYPGAGDSAERWFRTKPDLRITEVLDQLGPPLKTNDIPPLAFAAHPAIKPPFLEWLLIRRGVYQHTDYCHPNLTGMQIYNGHNDKSFKQGVAKWVETLLEGKRLSVAAGNDAHGNFARFRQIGFPFLTMREHEDQIFGKGRTGVLVKGELSKQSLLSALREGRSIISDGPFAIIQGQNEAGTFEIGDTVSNVGLQVRLYAQTTREFGDLHSVELFSGNISKKEETRLIWSNFRPGQKVFEKIIEMEKQPKHGYFRLVCKTKRQTREHWCLTNPIWIES